MGKFIRASVKYEAMIAVDDSMGLFRLAEAVPELKTKLLQEIKKNGREKLEKLTIDKLTYEEVIMPDPPTPITQNPDSSKKKDKTYTGDFEATGGKVGFDENGKFYAEIDRKDNEN